MKRLFAFTVCLILAGTGGALAQTKTATPRPPSVIHSETGIAHSPTHAFHVQLRKMMKTTAKDVKSGKLSQDQAQARMRKLKALRVQELRWMKENQSHELTQDQITQLRQQLNQVELNP